MNSFKDSLLYVVLFTFVVTFVFVAPLALTHSLTRERVAIEAKLREQRSVLDALSIEYNKDPQSIQEAFSTVKTRHYRLENKVYVETQDEPFDQTLYFSESPYGPAVAKRFVGPGLWGPITGIFAMTEDGLKTVGLQIIQHSETPGLGARITEPEFRKEFSSGESLVEGKVILVANLGSNKENKTDGFVDAISGASLTSIAMTSILSNVINDIRKIQGLIPVEEAQNNAFDHRERQQRLVLENFGRPIPSDLQKLQEDFLTLDVYYLNPNDQETLHGQFFADPSQGSKSPFVKFFPFEGFYGPVFGLLTLSADTKEIIRLQILSHEEKLGAPIAEPAFLGQFTNKKLSPTGKLHIRKAPANTQEDGVVEAITGATGTSLALEKALEQEINAIRKSLQSSGGTFR